MPLEIEPTQAAERLRGEDAPVLVDIREDWELEAGRIVPSEHVPMSDLGTRLDRYRGQELILYCAHGNRSLRLAKALDDAGFENALSLAGGITAWAEEGLPVELPGELDDAQRVRYSRHVLIPEIGVAGQQRLLSSNVLVIGAGGLGSPAALYLAAATGHPLLRTRQPLAPAGAGAERSRVRGRRLARGRDHRLGPGRPARRPSR